MSTVVTRYLSQGMQSLRGGYHNTAGEEQKGEVCVCVTVWINKQIHLDVPIDICASIGKIKVTNALARNETFDA